MSDADTIAAVATPPGVSAVAIVRISGSQAWLIAQDCFAASHPSTTDALGRLRHGWIADPDSGVKIDQALLARFRAPKSYTGEDLVELHVHGGAGVVASCLALVLRLGARLATAGEFTKRAFLNGRLDLTQAEAVADLISAESERAAKAAAHRLAGGLGDELRTLRAQLLERLVEIEAHLDYPDEVPAPVADALALTLRSQALRVDALLAGSGAARVLRDGIDCVIAGPPNAGKSSLLNALLQAERAIVSPVPGTTRDIIEDRVAVDGVVLRLRDTAGLRDTSDAIEAEGVDRARRAIGDAELVILVVDVSQPLGARELAAFEQTSATPRIVLGNKMDCGQQGLDDLRARLAASAQGDHRQREDVLVAGSVMWPNTVEELRAAIARLGWDGAVDANRALVASLRQIQVLTRARESLGHALATIAAALPIDLVSTDMRDAVAAYGEVTGDTVTEEVLDGIFARFCVGK